MKKFIKKKNKGFSLVELIIVIAIMVALIAVMAPSYVKYLHKARETVITDAAEQCTSFLKVEYGTTVWGEGVIRIGRGKTNKDKLEISLEANDEGKNTLEFNGKTGDEGLAELKNLVGFQDGKKCQTNMVYLIKISYYDVDDHPMLSSSVDYEISEETTYENQE